MLTRFQKVKIRGAVRLHGELIAQRRALWEERQGVQTRLQKYEETLRRAEDERRDAHGWIKEDARRVFDERISRAVSDAELDIADARREIAEIDRRDADLQALSSEAAKLAAALIKTISMEDDQFRKDVSGNSGVGEGSLTVIGAA